MAAHGGNGYHYQQQNRRALRELWDAPVATREVLGKVPLFAGIGWIGSSGPWACAYGR